VVHFPRTLFDPAAPEFEAIRNLLRAAERGVAFGAEGARAVARRLRALPRLGGLAAWCELVRILDFLAQSTRMETLVSPGYAPCLRPVAQRRIERIFQHVETMAGSSELGLTRLSQLVHMSPAALSRFFRQMTGRTLVSHITQTRLGMACRRLVDTDEGVAVIAFSCGFENLANFNRRFRQALNMTPTEYRARFARSGS
jgi:AraC-like DNA-binding protein